MRNINDKLIKPFFWFFAFLPLISDPVGNDKMRLFHDLDGDHEVELAADSPHPPVFACVMRKMTGNRGKLAIY